MIFQLFCDFRIRVIDGMRSYPSAFTLTSCYVKQTHTPQDFISLIVDGRKKPGLSWDP